MHFLNFVYLLSPLLFFPCLTEAVLQPHHFEDLTNLPDNNWRTTVEEAWNEATDILIFALRLPREHEWWRHFFGRDAQYDVVQNVFTRARTFFDNPPDDFRIRRVNMPLEDIAEGNAREILVGERFFMIPGTFDNTYLRPVLLPQMDMLGQTRGAAIFHEALHHITMADNTIIPMNQFPETFQQFYAEAYTDNPAVFIRDIIPVNFIDDSENYQATDTWLDDAAYRTENVYRLARMHWGSYIAVMNVNSYLYLALNALIDRIPADTENEANAQPQVPDAWTGGGAPPTQVNYVLTPNLTANIEISRAYGLIYGLSHSSKVRRENVKARGPRMRRTRLQATA